LAEVGGERSAEEMKLYTAGQTRLNSAYGFDYLYAEALTPEVVRQTIRDWPGNEGEGWPSWAFSNHDAPRFASRWWAEGQRDAGVRLALMLLIALRGNVILYQGEELGLPQAHVAFEYLKDPEAIANWPQTLGRDGARTPMPWTAAADGGFGSANPWLPLDPAHLRYSVELQRGDADSILNWTRRLVELRRETPPLRGGSIRLLGNGSDQVIAFERKLDGERLACVFNLSGAPAANPISAGTVLISTGGADTSSPSLPPASGFIARC
jgi:alpha-glucosidase